MSSLDARVRIREGLRALLDEGRVLSTPADPVLVNLLLDRCGSDHRPLVDLLCRAAHHLPPIERRGMPTEEWLVHREACVRVLDEAACLEHDAARWAVEALHYAHWCIEDDMLMPVVPFASTALPALVQPRRARAAVASAPRVTARASGTLHPPPFSAVPLMASTATPSQRSHAFGASLRFGQPWYAVQNGQAIIALPSPPRGPRRPPPIAPISGPRLFARWTRESVVVGGALGAATLTIAFSYWLMLNAARNGTHVEAIERNARRAAEAADQRARRLSTVPGTPATRAPGGSRP
jgi:hypothetical protein